MLRHQICNTQDGSLNLIRGTVPYSTRKTPAQMSPYRLVSGMVLFSRRRTTAGRQAVWRNTRLPSFGSPPGLISENHEIDERSLVVFIHFVWASKVILNHRVPGSRLNRRRRGLPLSGNAREHRAVRQAPQLSLIVLSLSQQSQRTFSDLIQCGHTSPCGPWPLALTQSWFRRSNRPVLTQDDRVSDSAVLLGWVGLG